MLKKAIAVISLKARLSDIKRNPAKHRHNFHELQECCMVDGALDMDLMDAHAGVFVGMKDRSFNGCKCDVLSGPCACGGWH